MQLQDVWQRLKENGLDGGIFDVGDEIWIIASAPIIPSIKALFDWDIKSIDRFSIRPCRDGWSMVILGPGMIDITIVAKNDLEELVPAVLEIYAHPEETTAISAMKQAVDRIQQGGLLTEWGDGSTTILGGTHLVNKGEKRVFDNKFAIFLHSTIWVGIRIKADWSSILIAYSKNLDATVTAVIEHFRTPGNLS